MGNRTVTRRLFWQPRLSTRTVRTVGDALPERDARRLANRGNDREQRDTRPPRGYDTTAAGSVERGSVQPARGDEASSFIGRVDRGPDRRRGDGVDGRRSRGRRRVDGVRSARGWRRRRTQDRAKPGRSTSSPFERRTLRARRLGRPRAPAAVRPDAPGAASRRRHPRRAHRRAQTRAHRRAQGPQGSRGLARRRGRGAGRERLRRRRDASQGREVSPAGA